MLNNEEHLKILKEIVELEKTVKQQKDKLDEISKKLSQEQEIRSKLELQYNKPIQFVCEGSPIRYEQNLSIKKNMKHFNNTMYLDGLIRKDQINKYQVWNELKNGLNKILDESVEDILLTYTHKTTYQTIYSANLWFVIPDKENL